MLYNSNEPITILKLNEISYLAYDVCKEKYGEPEKLKAKLSLNIEEYINGLALVICSKRNFIRDAKFCIMYYMEKDENNLILPARKILQDEVLHKVLVPYLEVEYKKVLSAIKFVNIVYENNKNELLSIRQISKKYNKESVVKFNLFLMLVYEFYKVRKRELNDATYRAFEIMDMLFGNSWNYIFYNLKYVEYLEFLEKNIYSNIKNKGVFLYEFNFKGIKSRYIDYLLVKTKNNIINSI